MSALELIDVCKRYVPSVPTIHKANITVGAGQFCVFVGPSGCGKSTLLRLVAGLEDISSGELRIDGHGVNTWPPARRGVAMVFQSYALYPHMTVRENMAFGLKVFGVSKAQVAAKVAEAADMLQLTPLLDRLPKALSGGQRQRVAIGRAIVKRPKVFLFDEPLSNLDASLRVQTRLEIARLHQRTPESSMVYVTHDQVEAMTLADQIVLLHSGEAVQRLGSVAQAGAPLQLYHRPVSRFVAEFMGSPKMNVLPGRLVQAHADWAQVQVGEALWAVAVDARGLASGAEVSVGIRPEHWGPVCASTEDTTPAADPSPCLSGHLMHIERLGESTLLYVEPSAGMPTCTVRADSEVPWAMGTRVTVQAPAANLHLFDALGRAQPRTARLPV